MPVWMRAWIRDAWPQVWGRDRAHLLAKPGGLLDLRKQPMQGAAPGATLGRADRTIVCKVMWDLRECKQFWFEVGLRPRTWHMQDRARNELFFGGGGEGVGPPRTVRTARCPYPRGHADRRCVPKKTKLLAIRKPHGAHRPHRTSLFNVPNLIKFIATQSVLPGAVAAPCAYRVAVAVSHGASPLAVGGRALAWPRTRTQALVHPTYPAGSLNNDLG